MTTWRLLVGDVRETLASLPAGSAQTCVTSPPYFGLRDYGVEGQIGLEATPAEYANELVAVFDEVRRVLRDDGTLWLNLGDSYAGLPQTPWYKAKDLLGIPWRVAFALRAEGWYLRSDIIWSKPNPMPESVTDRPTKAHEYIFLLSKSARYYYDAQAVAEPVSESMLAQIRQGYNGSATKDYEAAGAQAPSAVKSRILSGRVGGKKPDQFDDLVSGAGRSGVGEGLHVRNKRTVWTVATQPYAGAHFATFPEDLIEPCILAGSRPGDTVLDPFTGSGTTGAVAIRHQRSFVGCELNPAYVELARKRIGGVAPMFAEEVA